MFLFRVAGSGRRVSQDHLREPSERQQQPAEQGDRGWHRRAAQMDQVPESCEFEMRSEFGIVDISIITC